MNTHKQILVGTILLLTIVSTTLPAQAGFLDWFRPANANDDTAQTGSFDQLYASALYAAPKSDENPIIIGDAIVSSNSPAGSSQKMARRTYTVTVSGYNSEVAQTDDSPFITASNTHVRDGVVASNMFPFGTIIKIPSLYGNKIFVVEDRMNTRYQHNVDIWFVSKADALALGRRTVMIEVIK